MERQTASTIMLALLLVSMSTFAFSGQPVEAWSGTIYINIDGSMWPADAPIKVDGNRYTLTDNITSSAAGIIVQRLGAIIDGGGFVLMGSGAALGVELRSVSDVVVENLKITGFQYGTALINCVYCTIRSNILVSNSEGVFISSGGNNVLESNLIDASIRTNILFDGTPVSNTLRNNTVSNGNEGIHVTGTGHTIVGNWIKANRFGIYLADCSSCKIYHNNFVANYQEVSSTQLPNSWDKDGEGNYWSHLVCTDSDPLDGIGDAPYIITENNTDNHPLMGSYYEFAVVYNSKMYHLNIISNSSINSFSLNETGKIMRILVSGPDYHMAFCRITIPNDIVNGLWSGTCSVRVDGAQPLMNKTLTNTPDYVAYFTYILSEHEITIVPEFPSTIVLPLLMILSAVAVVVAERRKRLT